MESQEDYLSALLPVLVNMGVVYELEKNTEKAEQYYKLAAEAGNPDDLKKMIIKEFG